MSGWLEAASSGLGEAEWSGVGEDAALDVGEAAAWEVGAAVAVDVRGVGWWGRLQLGEFLLQLGSLRPLIILLLHLGSIQPLMIFILELVVRFHCQLSSRPHGILSLIKLKL